MMTSLMLNLAKPFAAKSWLLVILCGSLLPQAVTDPLYTPLYMPRTVKRAFANGTWSPDGRPGAPRNGGAAEAYLTSGVHIDGFAVNGQPTPWQDSPRYFTWAPVKLAAPLMPHDSVRLSFNWHYEIPGRRGARGCSIPPPITWPTSIPASLCMMITTGGIQWTSPIRRSSTAISTTTM